MSTLKLTRYAWPQMHATVAAMAVLAGVFYVKGAYQPHWIWFSLAQLPTLALLWVLWFFRDPDRTPPDEPHLLVSPADGTVTDLTLLGNENPLAREAMQVGVFMSVFSVHVNRNPADGTIDTIDHQPGAFLDARDPAASQKNESATITMTIEHDGRPWPIVFRQIAGLIARRIVTDLEPGQHVKRGDRMGMIKFGSRCELIVPRELAGKVLVEIGDAVLAGTTPLIALPHESFLRD
jgi:phosphatidylserine decarboxylase